MRKEFACLGPGRIANLTVTNVREAALALLGERRGKQDIPQVLFMFNADVIPDGASTKTRGFKMGYESARALASTLMEMVSDAEAKQYDEPKRTPEAQERPTKEGPLVSAIIADCKQPGEIGRLRSRRQRGGKQSSPKQRVCRDKRVRR